MPSRMQLFILCVMAILCAAVVSSVESQNTALLVLTFPVVVVAGLMGSRHGGFL